MREISGLSWPANAKVAMDEFIGKTVKPNKSYSVPIGVRFRYVVFSQARKSHNYGIDFAAYIRENNLGSLVETDFNTNPNTGNPIKAWIWTVDWIALKRFASGIKPRSRSEAARLGWATRRKNEGKGNGLAGADINI